MANRFVDVTKYTAALTGTLTFTNGSTTVTGSGTLFTIELASGNYIKPDTYTEWYKVASIQSDTSLTLSWAYRQTTISDSAKKNAENGQSAGTAYCHINQATTDQVRAAGDIIYCFPKGVEVLTPSGYKGIEEIKVGELVWSRNSLTKVNHTFERKYDGELITIKPQYLEEIRVTSNHPILVGRYFKHRPNPKKRNICRYKKIVVGWKPAGELTTKDYVLIPKFKDSREVHIEFPRQWGSWGLLPEKLKLTSKLACLFGWYIAEGSVRVKQGRGGRVKFSLGLHEKEYAEEIRNLIEEELGLPSCICKDKRTLNVFVTNKDLACFLGDNFGLGAPNKHLPQGFMYWKPEILRGLVSGFVKGDGNPTKGRVRAYQCTTTSKVLAKQLQLALLKLGYPTSLQKVEKIKRKIKGKYYRVKTSYQLFWSEWTENPHRKRRDTEDYWFLKIFRIKKEKFSGKVYNFETETSEYMVPFIVHNCRRGQTHLYAAVDIVFDEDGTANNPITLMGDDGTGWPTETGLNKPIIGFGDASYQATPANDDFWLFKDLDFRESQDDGALRIVSSRGVGVEKCDFHDNDAAGGIKRGLVILVATVIVKQCTFYNNGEVNFRVERSVARLEDSTFNGGANGTGVGLLGVEMAIIEIINTTFGVTTTHGTADIRLGEFAQIKCRNVILASATEVYAITATVNIESNIRIEDDEQTKLANRAWFYNGTITKDDTIVRSGGASSSARMEPNSNCGLRQSLELCRFTEELSRWLAAGSHSCTIYLRGSGWTAFPTADELYIEVLYYDGATAKRASVKSTEVLTANDTWTLFDVSFTLNSDSPCYVNVILKKYIAGAKIYVDILPVWS